MQILWALGHNQNFKLDCNEDGIVKMDVIDCAQKMANTFPVNLKKLRNVSSPAADCLCKARDDAEKLSKHKAEISHNMTAR